MSPEQTKTMNAWPAGFLPLPHPHHEAGGMIFPKLLIDETTRQTGRDLTRFDLDFDLPDHLIPEFPAALFLVTRPDLGDVSKGDLITLDNFERLFKENPKQLEGLRLLVTPFPQQQFNVTEDRRSVKAHQGVACFDCHANGHTNAATHTVGDIRPNAFSIGSILRRCAASVYSVSSDHSVRSRALRISPSSSSVAPTSMGIKRAQRVRGSTRWSAAARCNSWVSFRTSSTSRQRQS